MPIVTRWFAFLALAAFASSPAASTSTPPPSAETAPSTSTPPPTPPPTLPPTPPAEADELVVKVATFGRGDGLLEWFGHGALIVENRATGWSRLYNYGEFSFDATTLPRYALGHLTFHVAERPVALTLERYGQADRDVRLAELNLSPAQKQQLLALLKENVRPEHRDYLYDHYTDNCTTRVRDILDVVTGGELRAQSQPGTQTFRSLTRTKTVDSDVVAFVLDFLLNKSTDRTLSTWEEAFLPEQFEQQLLRATIATASGERVALVKHEQNWWKATRPPNPPPTSTSTFALYGVVLACVLIASGARGVRGVTVVVVGTVTAAVAALGTVLFLMATFTDHAVTHGNWNLALAHPLWGVFVPALWRAWRGAPQLLWRSAVAVAVVAVVGAVAATAAGQDVAIEAAVFVPVAVAVVVVAACARAARQGT